MSGKHYLHNCKSPNTSGNVIIVIMALYQNHASVSLSSEESFILMFAASTYMYYKEHYSILITFSSCDHKFSKKSDSDSISKNK